MSRFLATLIALSLAAVLAPAAAPAADAGPPTDYRKLDGLSQPVFGEKEIQRDVVRLPAFDGVELYIEVTRPKAEGRYPVILEASPYHGTLADREGTRILPDTETRRGSVGLTGWFAPRGYAVVMFDLRGTGRSRGCLDQLGPNDAKDLKQVVEWAASQDWSNGRVGMTGHSYVGSTPSVAAAQNPQGLVTIVPSAGLASMYDHQFQGGVPFFLQWAGPQWSYEGLAIDRKLPKEAGPRPLGGPTGDDTDANGLPNNPQDTGCGLPQSALVSGADQLSGRYATWHAERDHGPGAAAAAIPMFLVHGVNDNAARITAADWFLARGNRAGDKAWIGQWDHGSGVGPTRRQLQWTYALTAWFDKHLKGLAVETGPAAELFLSNGTFQEARTGDREWVVTQEGWPGTPTTTELFATGEGGMTAGAPADDSVTFRGDPSAFTKTDGSGGTSFVSEPVAEDLVLAGLPKLRLSASVTVPRVHLIATVYDVRPSDGNRRRISQCTINPELRDGLATVTPVVPATRYDLEPPCMAMAHHLQAGHRLALRVTTADPDKAPLFAVDPQITVFTGASATRLALPVVEDAALHPDTMGLR